MTVVLLLDLGSGIVPTRQGFRGLCCFSAIFP